MHANSLRAPATGDVGTPTATAAPPLPPAVSDTPRLATAMLPLSAPRDGVWGALDYVLPAELTTSSVLSAAMGPLGEFLRALEGHKIYWLSPDCLELITLQILASEAEEARADYAAVCTCEQYAIRLDA